jgi:2-polyprenyl-3-methyl-5-hydroxy-6-metoxy-1,4-benzoquinol methylase
MARIAIGIPAYGDFTPEVTEDLFRFAYHLGRRTDHEVFLAIKSKSEQFRARNAIIDEAHAVQATHLLFLDDDMVIDWAKSSAVSDAYTFLERLLAHDKDIVGGLYYQRKGECAPVAMVENGDGYRFLHPSEITHSLQPVSVVGGGCMLINMHVFDKVMPPYFEPESAVNLGTDLQICLKAAKWGYSVWLDSSFEVGHLRQERIVITSKNRDQFMTDLLPGDVKKKFVASDIYTSLFKDAAEFTQFDTMDKMAAAGDSFMRKKPEFDGTDLQWYREYAIQRVARQVWLNTNDANKRGMVEFILGTVLMQDGPRVVLDFGCGIGVPAFTLAQAGHAVTACDVRGTGTLNFLRWRTQKHGVPMTFHETETDTPHLGGAQFDVIVAMDVLEHLKTWPFVLRYLADRLVPGGILLCNNGVLDDRSHPEHYDLRPQEFITECVKLGLMPFNQIGYQKRANAQVQVAI